MSRWFIALVAVGMFLPACSGTGDQPSAATAVPISPAPTVVDGSVPASPTTTAVADPVPLGVSLTVSSDDLGVQADLTGDVADAGDPFGDFAVCSGHAAQIGSYIVGVGTATGSVTWASVATPSRVVGAGTFDADVRVEFASGDIVDAVGSLTLDPGLASGAFVATTVQGAEITGGFACPGGAPAVTGEAGTVAGLVEVVALLQRGSAERVVSAVSDDPDVAACPLGAGGTTQLVEVTGGPRTGSLSAFRLDDLGPTGGLMNLTAGAVSYAADEVEIALADGGDAGSFSAVAADGVAIDGAFSCTSA